MVIEFLWDILLCTGYVFFFFVLLRVHVNECIVNSNGPLLDGWVSDASLRVLNISLGQIMHGNGALM